MEERVHEVHHLCLRGFDLRTALFARLLVVEGAPQLQQGLHDLALLRAVERLGDEHDELVGLALHIGDRDRAARLRRVLERADERPHLVQDRGWLVKELAHERGIQVPARQPEDVVHPLRGLAVVQVPGEVLVHLLLEPVDVVVEGIL